MGRQNRRRRREKQQKRRAKAARPANGATAGDHDAGWRPHPGPERPGRAGGPGPERPGRAGGPGPERPGRAGGPGPERPGRAGGPGPERPAGTLDVELLLSGAAQALRACRERELAEMVEALVDLWDRPGGAPTSAVALGTRLERAVGAAWSSGWQPADVARVVKRKLGARQARLAVHVVAAESCSWRSGPDADPQWLAQLADQGAEVWWHSRDPHLVQWARAERLSAGEALRSGIELLSLLWLLPPLPLLGPPPCEWGRTPWKAQRARPARPSGSLDPKMLGRVRALLAKAESTTFPEEAEALTAKAQQLMTRHAIDQAMLETSDGADEPAARRLGVDDPYAAAKSLLLHEVADANRCRAVWMGDLGCSTVFGYPVDLDVVEVLYTSLLVQATACMVAVGSTPGAGRRPRSRSFRQSFLVAYATRIGQRLRESASDSVAEAQAAHGDALLPVLAGRADDVDEACEAAFPRLRSQRLGAHDGWGWAAGATAADRASLAVGPQLSSTAQA